MSEIEYLINKANLVIYKNKVDFDKNLSSMKEEEIPDYLREDCENIVRIFSERLNTEFPITLAYALWHTHSEVSFCAGWEGMDLLTDDTIYSTLSSLLLNIEF